MSDYTTRLALWAGQGCHRCPCGRKIYNQAWPGDPYDMWEHVNDWHDDNKIETKCYLAKPGNTQ